MSSSSDWSDRVREQAHRIAESGPSALSGLFDLTAHRLHRYAVTMTRNQHDAEDAVQSILAQIASKPRLLCQAQEPWHYLLRMVRNRVLQDERYRKKRAIVGNILDLLTRRSVDELEIEETHRAVWSALRKIPAEQSEVVVLKIWEEMSFLQIAALLEVSPGTVASRYRYAMIKLARFLEPESDEVHHG